MNDADLYWLGGLLEGEGTFGRPTPSGPNQPTIAIQMKDEDVIARAAKMIGVAYCRIVPKNKRHSVTYKFKTAGRRAVAWMTALRPLMSARRKAQIDSALSSYSLDGYRVRWRNKCGISHEDTKELIGRIKNGESCRSVGRRFGVNHETVRNIVRKHEGGIDLRVSRSTVTAKFGVRFSVPPPENFYVVEHDRTSALPLKQVRAGSIPAYDAMALSSKG